MVIIKRGIKVKYFNFDITFCVCIIKPLYQCDIFYRIISVIIL